MRTNFFFIFQVSFLKFWLHLHWDVLILGQDTYIVYQHQHHSRCPRSAFKSSAYDSMRRNEDVIKSAARKVPTVLVYQ